MPIYVYKCRKCGQEFELKQKFGANPPEYCPADGCDGKVVRVFTPPAIIFKGPGFHVTDYGRGSGGNGKRPRETADKISASSSSDKNSFSESSD